MVRTGERGCHPTDDALHGAGREPPPETRPAARPQRRVVYHGQGGHAPPIVSAEAHDPATAQGRRAICHLMALADYDPADFRTDIAYIRHCRARTRYLHEHAGDLAWIPLDDLLRRPPIAMMRSLLPGGWGADEDADRD